MAQTLKFGNGTWATKKGSTLAYNDEGGNFKPLPFTYTGAGKGTRVNKEGLIEVVENDRPRIDYKDSEDGVFLLEKAATNLLPYSNDFENSAWDKDNITVENNASISPDGTLNACEITSTASSSTIYGVILLDVIGSLAPNIKTNSWFVKSNGQRWVYICPPDGSYDVVYFDLENGIVGTGLGTSTGKIEPYPNGWYRISILKPTSPSYSYVGIGFCDGDNTSIYTQSSDTIFVYGSQSEIGNVASSYIPTQGTIQTRVQETANGSGNSEVFNNIEGTIFLDTNFKNNSGVQILCSIHDFATNKRLEIWANSNLINGFIGGSSNINVGSSNLINGSHKIALNYKSGNSSFYVDGFLIGSSSSSFTISALTKMNLGYLDGTQYSSVSPTKEIGYYDEVLTDLELETLTSYRTWEEMVKELNLNIIHNE